LEYQRDSGYIFAVPDDTGNQQNVLAITNLRAPHRKQMGSAGFIKFLAAGMIDFTLDLSQPE